MTRAEAIKTLAGLLDAFDQDEYGDYFYDNGWDVCEATILSLTALREQEEREQGCEWCYNFQTDPHFYVGEGNGQYTDVVFKFCPMCGRELQK